MVGVDKSTEPRRHPTNIFSSLQIVSNPAVQSYYPLQSKPVFSDPFLSAFHRLVFPIALLFFPFEQISVFCKMCDQWEEDEDET